MSKFAGIVLLTTVLITCVVNEDVIVETTLGNIIGEVEEITFDGSDFDVTKFLGIPFAEPPTGTRRFSKPIQKAKFKDSFIAKTMPTQCVQNLDLLPELFKLAMANQGEDCLYLNIFVPGHGPISSTSNLAVMIWIYGGAFQIGSQDIYNAKAFAGFNDVILVTLNYRVSFLGFLSTHEDNWSGNYGLWDQQMAIKWVHNHIKSFGGDPTKVTLFGESAGAASVIYQALFEGNNGLFQRVIAQSGSANAHWALERNPSKVFYSFANKSGCSKDAEQTMQVIECLRNLNVSEIEALVGPSDVFNPVKDGKFVSIEPTDVFHNISVKAWDILRRFGKVDIVLGVTSSDGGAYLPEIDQLTNTNATTRPFGYSRDMFTTIIIPEVMNIAKVRQSRALHNAIIQQYTEWSDPDNTETNFHNTIDLLSDILINKAASETAMPHSDASETGQSFFYIFDHKSLLSDQRLRGATHAEDIAFALGFPSSFAYIYKLYGRDISQNEIDLSKKMMKYWTNFAKTGDPNSDGLTHWPQYDSQTQKYIRLQAGLPECTVEDHFAARRMNFWHNLVPHLEQECDKTCPKCEDDTVSAGSLARAGPRLIISMLMFTWTKRLF